jgi:hypothetical protein
VLHMSAVSCAAVPALHNVFGPEPFWQYWPVSPLLGPPPELQVWLWAVTEPFTHAPFVETVAFRWFNRGFL